MTSQYHAQVAGDLERNLKEQERLNGEIDALREQLAALRHDHSVLVSIQQALGVPAAPEAPADEPVTAVPAPRKKPAAASGAAKQTKARKPAASAPRRASRNATAKAPAAESAPSTLVDLVRDHLKSQGEPCSAAEVTTALAQQHPERGIKTTVVRTTLEGLVAKNQTQRTKQGTSVFYTTPDTAETAADGEKQASQPSV